MKKLIFILMLLAISVNAQTKQDSVKAKILSWQGAFVGLQSLNKFSDSANKIEIGMSGTIGLLIREKYRVQLQAIIPLSERGVIYRIAMDYKIL